MITTAYLATLGVALAFLTVIIPVAIIAAIANYRLEKAIDHKARETIRFVDARLEEARFHILRVRHDVASLSRAQDHHCGRVIVEIDAMQAKVRGEQ